MSTTVTPTATLEPMPEPEEGAPTPERRMLLPAVMRSELTKLRSVRSTIWSLVATFGITAGFGTLFTWAYINRYSSLSLREKLTLDPTAQSLRGLFLAQLAIGVLGVLVMTSEYATGLIRTTLTAIPQRRTVLAAKAVTFGVVALVVSMISAFVAFLAGQTILNGKSLGVTLGDPGVLRAVLGAGAYLTIVGLLGLALGTILRRTAGAIATLFGLVLVFPLLAQALPSPWNNDIAKYLPSRLGEAMFSVRPDNTLLSPGTALVVAVIWLVATFGLATFLLVRRDA
jgi:ABC-type transport system involved in multi-copper enzyme maturation permease subunit